MAEDKLDQIINDLADVKRRLTAIEEEEKTEPWHQDLGSWAQEAFNPPGTIDGIVIDEGRAREGLCKCIPLGEGSRLCYNKGIVGALSQDQLKLYCTTVEEIEAPPKLIERQRILKDAAVLCQTQVASTPEGQRLQPFLKCMGKEAKSRGVQL